MSTFCQAVFLFLCTVGLAGCGQPGNRVVGENGQYTPEEVAKQLADEQQASEATREK